MVKKFFSIIQTMRKSILFVLFVGIMALFATSCSKDDKDDSFEYPMEQLYGKWSAQEILVTGKWYDVTKYPYTRFGMNITFYKDGTFYGSGYLGNGSGTYKTTGKKIITYIDGKEYVTYYVNSFSGNSADLTMTQGDESLQMKVKKNISF